MITPNTRYRFLKDTEIFFQVYRKAGDTFKTDSSSNMNVLFTRASSYQESRTISHNVLRTWLEDGRIEDAGRWTPNPGELYFYINYGGSVSELKYMKSPFSDALYRFGNMFETRERATTVAELIRKALTSLTDEDYEEGKA